MTTNRSIQRDTTNDWKNLVRAATRDNRTQLGTILLCAMGIEDASLGNPQFRGKATITSDGFVMCNFTDRNGSQHMGAFVGDVDDLVSNVRGLAAHLKLNDLDRVALFRTVQDWIAMDYRANPGLGLV